jgi:thiol-disulfide isomerase/thioredoxin
LYGFAEANEPNVTLTFETKNSNGETAILYQLPPIGKWIELGKAKPDEKGLLNFSIHLDKPQRLIIIYKDRSSSNLFIKPDTDYRFYVDYDGTNVDITNENTEDVVNLFFGKWQQSNGSFTYKDQKPYELKGDEKVAAFDKEEANANLFLKDFVKKYQPDTEEYFFIESFIHNSLLGMRFNHMMDGESYENLKELVASEELNKLFNKIRLDPRFLRLSTSDYAFPLSYYTRFASVKAFVEDQGVTRYEDVSQEMYLNFIKDIPKLSIPVEIKEYLLARQISDVVQAKEMYAELMPVMQSNYPDSEYIPVLKDLFSKAHNLDGNPAPDIKGITVLGDSISLTSLKGKVVYLDFWATWCGPCRAEFPKSIELKKQFEVRDDVVFMYVSVDEETEKWQKYVKEHPELKGLHVNGYGDYREGFGKAYGIGGIPHYVLINKEGIVVESNAPRPSDERTVALIKEQL